MPKHPHILKRDGRYYYRRRISSDLVEAKCYGKSKDIKKSLKTGDLATANRLAKTIALEVDSDFEAKRREVGLASRFAKCASAVGARQSGGYDRPRENPYERRFRPRLRPMMGHHVIRHRATHRHHRQIRPHRPIQTGGPCGL